MLEGKRSYGQSCLVPTSERTPTFDRATTNTSSSSLSRDTPLVDDDDANAQENLQQNKPSELSVDS